jgi:hypothetical protein
MFPSIVSYIMSAACLVGGLLSAISSTQYDIDRETRSCISLRTIAKLLEQSRPFHELPDSALHHTIASSMMPGRKSFLSFNVSSACLQCLESGLHTRPGSLKRCANLWERVINFERACEESKCCWQTGSRRGEVILWRLQTWILVSVKKGAPEGCRLLKFC